MPFEDAEVVQPRTGEQSPRLSNVDRRPMPCAALEWTSCDSVQSFAVICTAPVVRTCTTSLAAEVSGYPLCPTPLVNRIHSSKVSARCSLGYLLQIQTCYGFPNVEVCLVDCATTCFRGAGNKKQGDAGTKNVVVPM